MTRIIAGNLGSLRLKTAAKATRPTSDRVKESVFSKLEVLGVLEGAKVLDLFAGTGALGLEAISRGSKQVTFIEKDFAAFQILMANIDLITSKLDFEVGSSSLNARKLDALSFVLKTDTFFDLIFFDPPYLFPVEKRELVLAQMNRLMTPKGLLVFEHSSSLVFGVPVTLRVIHTAKYGDTSVTFLRRETFEEK